MKVKKSRLDAIRLILSTQNISSQEELLNELAKEGKSELCEDDITNALYTKDSPELDMIVRTGGDIRISNFLLWQAAYAELYFIDKLWPDLTADDVDKAIEEFNRRQRRFGGV